MIATMADAAAEREHRVDTYAVRLEGVSKSDMVARSRWSRSMPATNSSGRSAPSAAFSSRRFFRV